MGMKPEKPDISRVHRRQFIVSDVRIDVPTGWRSIGLGNDLVLHHCPWLNVGVAVDASGQHWALVGNVFEVNANLPDPVIAIGRSTTNTVPALAATWSGRWLLICASAVITDAAALLGVYILENSRGLFISSSLALISQLTPTSVRDSRVLGWYGLNWFPGPLCKIEGAHRLLPDQIYNPQSRSINFFDRLSPLRGVNLNEAANEVSGGLTRIFHAMLSQGSPKSLILTLTGGLDSRTTFSVLHASGVPFQTLTLEHPRISRADIKLPATISAARGIVHRYVAGDKLERGKLDEYDLHTYSCVVDGDRHLYARGSYENLGAQNWLIRSGCWELGRKYFHQKLRGLSLEELLTRPDRLMSRFKTFFGNDASANSLREWARWRLDHPVGISWKDLFYRDQRLGCWSSSIEQSLDLLDPISIHPVNCDHFYSLMLGLINTSGTTASDLQHAIIERCTPDLASMPVNPPEGGYIKAKTILLKVSAIVRGESNNLLRSYK